MLEYSWLHPKYIYFWKYLLPTFQELYIFENMAYVMNTFFKYKNLKVVFLLTKTYYYKPVYYDSRYNKKKINLILLQIFMFSSYKNNCHLP